MQVFYSVDNLDKRYWAWCVKLHLKENVIYYYNNIAQIENCIVCKTSTDAIKLYDTLFKGVSMSELVSQLESCGFNGVELYVCLMQNGIIE